MSPAAKRSPHAKSVPAVPSEEQNAAVNPFPIVGIGASAGGLEAFTKLLRHLPLDTGMAFVLVQHLDPHHESQLTDLLSRATRMPVLQVKTGLPVKPNHVYVIPPNVNMILSRGKLKLTPRGDSRLPHPVDHFFSSLAGEQQSWAVGVVLSGTGSDGAIGMKDIKEAGGITFAQDEVSARFSGMPAQAAGDTLDFVLPPEKIALELARIGQDAYLEPPSKTKSQTDEAAELKKFHRVLALLRIHTGMDLTQYRDTTIRRRIQRRMVVRNRHTLQEYIELLEHDRAETHALFDDVLINVTSFFRDPEMYDVLKTLVFPEILKSAPQTIRVWVAACSTGQEAYSLAIALLEFLEEKQAVREIQIFATDVSESVAIEKGRRGFYPETIEAEVSPDRLRRFFTKEDGGYRISKTIRDVCIFAKQNIAADPPFSRMDLVSCRNLLIYLTGNLQKQLISTFHYALNSPGYLILGHSETVGGNSDLFEMLDRKNKIFSKKGAAIRPFSHFTMQEVKTRNAPPRAGAPLQSSTPSEFQKEADRILLGRYAPAGVLVNGNWEILQFRGRTSPYLEPASGEASFNLLKMARENLSLELATALREAKKQGAPVRRQVRFHEQDEVRKVGLEILPIKLTNSPESCFLVLFKETDQDRYVPPAEKTGAVTAPSGGKDKELTRLRGELAAAREYLQATIEQQEAANEELKCANEEVLSSNEELQSTNEQLGTAKEELQSTNEELQTLNEELQTRNTELNQTNNDLANLLAGVPIPILMLGNDLRVRRFNPAAVELLNLKTTVVGRPIHAVDSPLITANLESLLLEVINRVVHKQLEIRDHQGHWFSLRLHPYRTSDNRIDGVILALVDIDELKRAHEKLQDYVTAIVDTVRAPLLVLHPDLRVSKANDAFYNFFQLSPAETEEHLLHELGNGQWNIPELRRQLSKIAAGKGLMKDFEFVREFPGIGRRMLRLNARRLLQKTGVEPLIVVSLEDITEWKQADETNRWLAAIVEASDDAILSEDLEGRIISCNRGAAQLYGYTPDEIIGKPITIFGNQALKEEQTKIIEKIRKGGSVNHFETVRQHKDGTLLDVSLTVSPVKNLNGKVIGISKIARDITERKRAERFLTESLAREKAARQSAEAASHAKDDFLAALSHELRTPLNPVLLIASDAVKDRELPPQVRANFDTIRKNIELEARLIDDLLDMTRITSGKVSLEIRTLDAHAVLQDALNNARSDVDKNQLKLEVNLHAARHHTPGDSARLQQVFANILSNAVKFSRAGGKITVKSAVSKDGDKLLIKITDTGMGMTEAELGRVFTAFSQGDHANAAPHRFGGLGLGLAISRKLVELHNGSIQAASGGRDKGSTFTVELPLAEKEIAEPAPKALPPSPTPSTPKSRAERTRILVIEDHEATRSALTLLLLRRNYFVRTAGSLAEGRSIAEQEKFDFVISDIGLPDGNGNDLMLELHKRFGLKGVALTGYGMDKDVERSLAAGFVAHLTKPVRIQALEKVLALPALT